MSVTGESPYEGRELDLFSRAVNWKRYIRSQMAPHLVGDVLEVGAGIGSTTLALYDGKVRTWLCLEPDERQAKRLRARVAEHWGSRGPRIVVGSLRSLAARPSFDCALYVDVLEHIEDDREEIRVVSGLVRAGGTLVVLAPAHAWLYTEFDRRIGHFRRYTKRELRDLAPVGWLQERLCYLDSAGLLASLGNALVLRRGMPSRLQIGVWDSLLVPCSRAMDPVLSGRLGKSVLAIWRRPS